METAVRKLHICKKLSGLTAQGYVRIVENTVFIPPSFPPDITEDKTSKGCVLLIHNKSRSILVSNIEAGC